MIHDRMVAAVLRESSAYGVESLLAYTVISAAKQIDALPADAPAYYAPNLTALMEILRDAFPSGHLHLERVFVRALPPHQWEGDTDAALTEEYDGPNPPEEMRDFFPNARYDHHILILNEPVCHSSDPAVIADLLDHSDAPRVLTTHQFTHRDISHPYFCHKSPHYPGRFFVVSKDPARRSRADSLNLTSGSRKAKSLRPADYCPLPATTPAAFCSLFNSIIRTAHTYYGYHAQPDKPPVLFRSADADPSPSIRHLPRIPVDAHISEPYKRLHLPCKSEDTAIRYARDYVEAFFYIISQLNTPEHDMIAHHVLRSARRADWLRLWTLPFTYLFECLSFASVQIPSYTPSEHPEGPRTRSTCTSLDAAYLIARRIRECRPTPAALAALKDSIRNEYSE